jgi:hypothetical protein
MMANKDELGFEGLRNIRVLVFGCWFSITRSPLIPGHPIGDLLWTVTLGNICPHLLHTVSPTSYHPTESLYSFIGIGKDCCGLTFIWSIHTYKWLNLE